MSLDIQNLRDALTDTLHTLADDQDEHARAAIRTGDTQKETAHRGAAIGLRMAAGVVSEKLTSESAAKRTSSLHGVASSMIAATFFSRPANSV